MFAWSAVPGLLLTVVLIFNEAAPGSTATRAGDVAAARVSTEPAPADNEAMPCHGHDPKGTAQQSQTPPDDKADLADCCESGACRCACADCHPGTVVDLGLASPVIEPTTTGRPMNSGHADAASAHLIRPPIG